jgi:N-sulfoglucosamine sulfohydrolase
MSKLKCLIMIACALFAQAVSAQTVPRPNILLLMTEDMSARVGTFGDSVAITPNLDALAAEGVRYPNTFTTAGVCAPSRAAHILGMHQISTGTQHMRASSRPEGGYYAVPPDSVKAYPELLRAAGYYTYTDNKLDYQFSSPFPGSGPATIWDREKAAAADWGERAPGQPFFGFINFQVTHESGIFRPLGSLPHSPTHFIMQLMRWYAFGAVPEVVDPQDIVVPPYYPDTPTVRGDMARHYNNIAYMDGEVGGILHQLAAAGLADTTIVIWTTDHGDGLPRAKRELFDSGIKVPMIIRWPEAYRPAGVMPGAVDERLISFVDLGPTILSLAGVHVPAYMQGSNFADASAAQNIYIYASRDRIDEVMDRQRAIRDKRYKYIRSWYPNVPGGTDLKFRNNMDMAREMRAMYEEPQSKLNATQALWYEASGEERLYDLENDPFEINDVSHNPKYAGVLRRMANEMDVWLARVGDWSETPESVMVERFEPDGERQVTPAPMVSMAAGKLVITPGGSGHSLAYRLDDGHWQLYTAPVSIDTNITIEARAVRYGWEESAVVSGP